MSFGNGKDWVGEAPPTVGLKREGRVKHVVKSVIEAGLVTALTFGLIAGSTFAAKGSNRPSGGTAGSLAGPVLLRDADASGSVSAGDDVTFNVSSSASSPFVGLRCSQAGNMVYDAYVGYYSSYMFDQWFTLAGPYWNAAADTTCTARLFYYNKRGGESVQATLSFLVTP